MYTNYYNPYMYNHINRKKFNFKKFDFNKTLSNASKTLNVINQAIPIYYQVKPILANARTLFKVANILKTEPVVNALDNTIKSTEVASTTGNPTFFL